MATMTIDEAASRLSEVIANLRPGEELILTRDAKPVAKLQPTELPTGMAIYGRGKDTCSFNTDDESHLADFAEYLQ